MMQIGFDIPDDKLRELLLMATNIDCTPTLKVSSKVSKKGNRIVFDQGRYRSKQNLAKEVITNFIGVTVRRLLMTALRVLDRAVAAETAGFTIAAIEPAERHINADEIHLDRLNLLEGDPKNQPWTQSYKALRMPALDRLENERSPLVVWSKNEGVRWKMPLKEYRTN